MNLYRGTINILDSKLPGVASHLRTVKRTANNIQEKAKTNKIKAKKEKERLKNEMEQIDRFIKEWVEVMENTSTTNKNNDTFSPYDIKVTDYGLDFKLFSVAGLTYERLLKVVPEIEQFLFKGCSFYCSYKKREDFINGTIVKKFPEMFFKLRNEYSKFKINGDGEKELITALFSQYDLFFGHNPDSTDVVIDLRKNPHPLIFGSTGGGKTMLIYMILSMLAYNNDRSNVRLFLAQATKGEIDIFGYLKICDMFANSIEECVSMLWYLMKEIMRRTELLKPLSFIGKEQTIDNYNEFIAKTEEEKLSTYIFLADEASTLFDTSGCSKHDKDIKDRIRAYVDVLAQAGRSVGIFAICATQRPTVDKFPPFLKGNTKFTLSFCQSNSKSSEVATGDTKAALNLPNREAVYDDRNGGLRYLRTDFFEWEPVYKILKSKGVFNKDKDDSLLKQTVAEFTKVLDIEEEEGSKKKKDKKKKDKVKEKIESFPTSLEVKEITKEEKTIEDFSKVETLPKDIMENINKIKDFVPYIDYSKQTNIKVKDETDLTKLHSEKVEKK